VSDTERLEKLIHHRFRRKKLLQQALTHPCLRDEKSYERLEFLGDLVLDLIVGLKLFQKFPQAGEAFLTNLKSSYVNRRFLESLGAELKLDRFVNRYHGQSTRLDNIVEALVGAIFLDRGMKAASRFVSRFILTKKMPPMIDYKNLAATVAHTLFKTTVTYQLQKSAGLKHQPVFQVKASLTGRRNMGQGRGSSVKEAQMAAARNLVEKLLTRRGLHHSVKKILDRFLAQS